MESAPGGQETAMEDDLDDLYGDAPATNVSIPETLSEKTKSAQAQFSGDDSTKVQLPGITDQPTLKDDTGMNETASLNVDTKQTTVASIERSNGESEERKALPTFEETDTKKTLNGDVGDQQRPEQSPTGPVIASRVPNGAAEDPGTGVQAEWEADSSPYESSSDDSSDTTSSGSEDEYELLDPAEQARRLMEGDANSDDEGNSKEKKGATIKSHNEQTDEPFTKPDIKVTEDMPIEMLGAVETVVENIALIKANISGEYQVLESGSLLCLSSRNVVGVVSETLGRVQQPLYCVRFESGPAMLEAGIAVGTTVYYVPQHSTFVFTKALQEVKGSDASNIHDEEIAADEMEFSDDEAEAAYKRNIKAQKRDRRLNKSDQRPSGYSQSRDGEGAETPAYINYDDEPQDELYTPLARPSNLHEMMNQTNGPARGSGTGYRGGRGRGDRRGDRGHQRGRGDRSRGRPQHNPYPAVSQPYNIPPTAESKGPPPPVYGYNAPAAGTQPPGHHYGAATGFTAGVPYAFPPPFPGGPPYGQGFQQQYPSVPYPASPPLWAPQYGGQQQFGQQAQYPPPPPPPPPHHQYQYGSGAPGSPQFPQGAAINPRFFQAPHNQQQGR